MWVQRLLVQFLLQYLTQRHKYLLRTTVIFFVYLLKTILN